MTVLLGAFVPSGCFNLNSGTGLAAFDAANKLEAGALRDARKREEKAAERRASGGGSEGGSAH